MKSRHASRSRVMGYVAGIVLVSWMAIGAYAADAAAGAANAAIGEITYTKGKVSIVNTGCVERAAAVKAAVYRDEKVSCGAGSKLEIRFTDASVLSIGEHSELIIDQYVCHCYSFF